MKVVSRTELMRLPAGTLYHEWIPCDFGPLCIKGESIMHEHLGRLNDWWQVVVPSIDEPEQPSYIDRLFHLDEGAALPVTIDLAGREALFDDKLRYAVWERADVELLHRKLSDILKSEGGA